MTRIEPYRGGWLVHTPDGIECQTSCMPQHLRRFASKFKPLVKAIAVSTFIIATEPLGERAKEPSSVTIWLSATTATSPTTTASCRRPPALSAGKDNELSTDPYRMTELVRQDMLKVFPSLADVKNRTFMGGECDITANLAPTSAGSRPMFTMPKATGTRHGDTGIAGLAIAEAIMVTMVV